MVALPAQASDVGEESSISNLTAESVGLRLPAVDTHFREYIAQVDSALFGEDAYSTLRILDDRSGIEIYWHGEPSAEVLRLVAAVPAGFAAIIVDTPFQPSELRAEVQRLIDTDAVIAAGLTPEADGLSITLAEGQAASRVAPDSLSVFPVEVQEGGVEPASARHEDTVGAGGALIRLGSADNWCTSGFTAQNSAGSKSMLTAAHCGSVGTGISSWGNGISWGTITSRSVTHDAALVGPRSGGFIASTWRGSWIQADHTMPISGIVTPVVGDEICLSGAISGDNCGHIVQSAGITWNFPDSGMSNITGYQTSHIDNQAAQGKGDSGGPGTVFTGGGAQPLRQYAATITSGIRDSPGPGYCDTYFNYPPAEVRKPDRLCSKNVLLTSARQAAAAFNLTISSVNV